MRIICRVCGELRSYAPVFDGEWWSTPAHPCGAPGFLHRELDDRQPNTTDELNEDERLEIPFRWVDSNGVNS